MKPIIILTCIGFLLAGETTTTYKVEGMMCGVNCPKAVKKSLQGVDWIKTCVVDFNEKTTTITYDDEKIDKKKIADTISKGTYFKVTENNKKKTWSFWNWLFKKS